MVLQGLSGLSVICLLFSMGVSEDNELIIMT